MVIRSFVAFAVCGCLNSIAGAVLVISADVDTTIPGIQSERLVGANETFDVDIVFELTDTTSLRSYTISTRYDGMELDFDSGSDPTPPGFNLGTDTVLAGVDTDSGDVDIDLIEASAFPTGPAASPGSPVTFTAATLTFTAMFPTGDSTDIDILPGTFDKSFNGLSDNDGIAIAMAQVIFAGGSISIVPESSAGVLVPIAFFVYLMSRFVSSCFRQSRRSAEATEIPAT